MAMWPIHIWYFTLASDVSPNSGSTDEPRVTGKNRKARHMFPTRPSLRAALSSFDSHLPKQPPPYHYNGRIRTKYKSDFQHLCQWLCRSHFWLVTVSRNWKVAMFRHRISVILVQSQFWTIELNSFDLFIQTNWHGWCDDLTDPKITVKFCTQDDFLTFRHHASLTNIQRTWMNEKDRLTFYNTIRGDIH